MLSLIFGTAFFVGIHLFIAGTTVRDRITDTIGEGPYMGLFSLASLGGIVWMCSAYAQVPGEYLWGPIPGMRALATYLLMPIAFLSNSGILSTKGSKYSCTCSTTAVVLVKFGKTSTKRKRSVLKEVSSITQSKSRPSQYLRSNRLGLFFWIFSQIA